jgi:hypothetical protein
MKGITFSGFSLNRIGYISIAATGNIKELKLCFTDEIFME